MHKRTKISCLLAALFMAVTGGSASAERIRDWDIACEAGSRCVLTQISVNENQSLLAVSRLMRHGENGARIEVAVPEGVHLASGIFLATGAANPRALEWVRCEDGLCIAAGMLGPDELRAWKLANRAALRYRPALQDGVREFSISLLGLTEALRRSALYEGRDE